jgi:SagB-type dehydrogenase family enzyme
MKVTLSVNMLFFLTVCLTAWSHGADPLPPIQLSPPETSGGMPLMQALHERMSTKEFSPRTISQQQVSNLLWAAYGINRPESGKRTIATAVNCQDIAVYVVLEKGAYVYEAEEHRLIPVVDRDLRSLAATQDYAQVAPINLVYVSDHRKMADRFGDKKRIYGAFHAGSISQNVYLYCASAGLGSVVRDSVDRTRLGEALKLSEEQVIVMAQSVGYAAEK